MAQRSRTIVTAGPSRMRQAVVYARVSSKEQEKEGSATSSALSKAIG